MPHHGDEAEERVGVAAWLRRWWRALAGELVATALLVLLGVASLLQPGDAAPTLAGVALAFGFVVLALVQVFGPVSGAHMNPAVTLAALLAGRMGAGLAAAYGTAQAAGALLGFGALKALAGAAADSTQGCTAPAASVGAPAAAGVEALLTGVLALLCCSLWAAHDDARPDPSVPVKFGLTVAGLVFAGGLLSGASLNPVRSFAPALLQGYWTDHWVYWVGPLGGAAAATLLHRYVLLPTAYSSPASRHRRPEELPLNDKPDC